MQNCNEHPGFFPDQSGTNHQLTQEQIKNNPELRAGFDAHMQSLSFDDFFNECWVHLSDADEIYRDTLREAAETLFNNLRYQVHPDNSDSCTIEAAKLVEKGTIPNEYGNFKLVFVLKEPLYISTHHLWIELIESGDLSEEELIQRYANSNLRRLIIDFPGLPPSGLGIRTITNVMHNRYTPFLGSPALASERLRRKYLNTREITIVHQLTGVKFLTSYPIYLSPETHPFTFLGLES